MTKGGCCFCTVLGSGSNPGATATLIELSSLRGQSSARENLPQLLTSPKREVWCVVEVGVGCMSLFQQESLGRP